MTLFGIGRHFKVLQLFQEVIGQEYSATLVLGTLVAVAVNAASTWAVKILRTNLSIHQFIQNSITDPIRKPRRILKRVGCIKRITDVLKSGPLFYTVTGDKGSGKSWIVQQAAQEVPGSLYVCLPANLTENDFVSVLAQALEFHFEERLSWAKILINKLFGSLETSEAQLSDLAKVLQFAEDIAKRAQDKLAYTPTLILDNCGYLEPELFGKLQDWAYDCCCRGTLRLMFVMSQKTQRIHELLTRPSGHRMELIWINAISEDEAVEYLVKEGIQQEEAQDLVQNYVDCNLLALEITCQRLHLEKQYTSYMHVALDKIRSQHLEQIKEWLRLSQLESITPTSDETYNTHRYHTWKTLLHMSDTRKPMPYLQWADLVSSDSARIYDTGRPFPFRRDGADNVRTSKALLTYVEIRAGKAGSDQRKEFMSSLDQLIE